MAANQLVNEIMDGVIPRMKLKNVNEPTSNRLCSFSAFPSIKYIVDMYVWPVVTEDWNSHETFCLTAK